MKIPKSIESKKQITIYLNQTPKPFTVIFAIWNQILQALHFWNVVTIFASNVLKIIITLWSIIQDQLLILNVQIYNA